MVMAGAVALMGPTPSREERECQDADHIGNIIRETTAAAAKGPSNSKI